MHPCVFIILFDKVEGKHKALLRTGCLKDWHFFQTTDAHYGIMHGERFVQSAKQMDLNVTEFMQFIITVLDSTLQLAFKKLPLVEVWCSTKWNIHKYLKRMI